jgi:hypothetical protein
VQIIFKEINMKKRVQTVVFYMLALILGGCVPSLHPLFTENQLVFDSNLVGKWAEPNTSNYWQFAPDANSRYDVVFADDKGKAKFTGCLGKIGNDTFLDIFPEDMNIPGNEYYKAHLIGAHSFLRVDLTHGGLNLQGMNPDGIDKLLKTDPNAIKHETAEKRTILTASTPELQKFVAKHAHDPNIYGPVSEDKLLKKVIKQDSNSVK